MTAADLDRKLYERPFLPFRIHLSDGTTLAIMQPDFITLGDSSALVPSEIGHDSDGFKDVKRWRTISISHIVQFSEVDEVVGGKRPKRRGK